MTPEFPTTREATSVERIFAGVAILAASAASGFVWFFNPSNVNFFPVCPLYSLTGLACPGCGLTRGFHALFHGDVLAALDYNLLTPLFAVFFCYGFVSLLMTAVRGKGISINADYSKHLWILFVIIGVFAVLRNIPFYPFTILYP